MKFVRFLAVIFLCLSVRPAVAAYVTGNDLLRECKSSKAVNVARCMSYVAGVIDYQLMLQSLGTEPPTDFCLPRHFPLDKATLSVMVYLQKNPSLGPFIAAPTVAMALARTYPCAQSPTPPRKKKHHHG